MSAPAPSLEYVPSFEDSTVYDSSVPSTSVMATMVNDDTAVMTSWKTYLYTGGLVVGSTAWGINRQIVSRRRAPSSIFANSLIAKSAAVSRPIARTASNSILFSTPVAVPAWSPFAMPILVPMFRTTNTASVAFVRPISCHNPVSPSTVTRLMAAVPSTQTILVVSFLSFVGYKNYIYYQQQQFADEE